MAEWIDAEKTRAGLRHVVVRPNVTGKTKERIAQSKRARNMVRLPLLTSSHKWRELVSYGRLVCRWRDVFLWCDRFVLFYFVFVFMLSLEPRPFVQSFLDMQAPR